MTLIVKKAESFDPMDIGFLGSWTIVAGANRLTDLIEQLGLLGCWKTDRGTLCDSIPRVVGRNGNIVLQRDPP